MTQQRLHSALAPLDVLTRVELEESLHKGFEEAERARVRGISYIEFNETPGTITALQSGPESGYAWSLKVVSIVVTAAATVSVYLGDSANTAPVGQTTLTGAGSAIFTYTSNIVVVRDARNIFLVSSAGLISNYKILAKQVPNEMIGKL